MIAPSLLLISLSGLQGLDTASADGRWVARVRKAPGQERVDDRIARWRVSVHDADGGELWHCRYDHGAVPGRTLLSDDGSTFVLVTEAYSSSRPIVRIFRQGFVLTELTGRDFELERKDVEHTRTGARWLHEDGDEVHLAWRESEQGIWLALELESSRGWTRTADLSMGAVHTPHTGEATLAPGVDPEFAYLAEAPYVQTVNVPAHMLFGVPVEVRVTGSHPTPNWQLGGFELEWLDDEGTSFAILPRSLPPPANTFQAQVIEGFNGTARLQGLRPGSYTVTARGREEQALPLSSFEVLPGRLRVRLSITAGIAGVGDTVEVYSPGVARTVRSFRGEEGPQLMHLPPALLERLDRTLPSLPREPKSAKTNLVADFFEYHLEWWSGERWLEVHVDDGTAKGDVREMIELLREL